MTHTPQSFTTALTAWRQWQESPWGQQRFALAEANVSRHIGPGSAVLDLAGADGGDAIRLAQQGHRVTIVDITPAMLDAATERAQAAGVDIACVEADALDLPNDIGVFDVVLCHNLLQYVPDPVPVLKAAVKVLHPNGFLSVMTVADGAARTHMFDAPTAVHTVEEIDSVLVDLGCAVVDHYVITARIFQIVARSLG